MFPFWYCSVCQSCEDNSFLSTSLHNLSIASPVLFGHPTTLYHVCHPPFLVVWHTKSYTGCGWYRFSPVDLKSLYSMNRSSTPQKCVKSHHIDKPTCWLLPRWQHRPSGVRYFGAQWLSLLSRCLRLATGVTNSNSKLTSGGLVNSFPDRISTCTISSPCRAHYLTPMLHTAVLWKQEEPYQWS